MSLSTAWCNVLFGILTVSAVCRPPCACRHSCAICHPLIWGVLVSDFGGEEGSGHTSGRMTSRIEVIGRISGRRRWTVEQKLGMLRDAFGPDGRVRSAMERHEVSSGQL